MTKMHFSAGLLSYGIAIGISIMFFYAATSKLLNFKTTKEEMLKQVFPKVIALQLAWIVPFTELLVTCLLLIRSTQLAGFYVSAVLLFFFSIYIAVTSTGIFGDLPCSCAGILNKMSYNWHLIFNLIFLLLALAGIAVYT